MIRAILHKADGSPMVVLGLGEENMRRLRNGEPIKVNLKRLDPTGGETELPDIDVVVVFDDGTLTPTLLDQASQQT